MTYSKLGNIKGPQGRRGINMTGGTTTPPAVDDSVLEGDLWLDSVTGDVYRATDPLWAKDGSWNTWGTVLWKVADNTLMVQPAEGDTGTTGKPADFGYFRGAPWCSASNNPSVESMTSVRSKGTIAMNASSNSLFKYCTSLTDISPLSGWDTSGVTNMNDMFYNCKSLTNLSPISGWDVSGVTSMTYMFSGCKSLTDLSPISNWNISGVTDMGGMFQSCDSLTDLSALSGWDISGVTSVGSMFGGCTSLTNLSPISGWDISGVTSVGSMFGGCTSLTNLSPISGWDVSGVTDMSSMFSGCTSLTNLSPISGWDTSGVTSMTYMFNDCTSLTDISPISGWDVSNMENMAFTFQNCPLERIGVPSLAHGGKNFVSNLKSASAVADMDTTMLTNTTTHETMSANQILTDMDTTPSKYATGTIWTIARA